MSWSEPQTQSSIEGLAALSVPNEKSGTDEAGGASNEKRAVRYELSVHDTSSDDALAELEQLLELEAGSLARLDLANIEAIAERKEQLLAQLRAVVTQPSDRARLERIRTRAISNQLLTVHARDAIASIVFAATPGNGPTYAPGERGAPRPGVRLDVRG